ncbi:MAG: transporter substrate-binding protein [Planctomycetota bacterium]
MHSRRYQEAIRNTALLWLLAALATSIGCEPLNKASDVLLNREKDQQTIKLGVLHSQTGTMGMNEMSLRHCEILAVEEINASKEFPNVEFVSVVRDGRSRSEIFRRRARELVDREQVDVIFGCWTSLHRKAVIDELDNPTELFRDEHFDGKSSKPRKPLLFYPLQYEGFECNRNVFYFGSTPNQQILPALDWFMSQEGGQRKRIYLIGSDYLFPRTANYIVKKYLENKSIEIVGEDYFPLGHSDFHDVVKKIEKAAPDLILSTINGESNLEFYKQCHSIGIDPEKSPVLATSVGEGELRRIPPEYVHGHYAAWSYFQSLDTPANQAFVRKFKKAFGLDRVVDDPMEAAYTQVMVWKEAYKIAKSSDPIKIREVLEKGLEFDAPGGKIKVDPKTHHLYKKFRLGRIGLDRQFEIVYESRDLIAPEPFPSFAFPGGECDWTRGGLTKGPPPNIGL